MLRPDIMAAAERTPVEVQKDLQTDAAAALELLSTHLPEHESVSVITSVKATKEASLRACVLAITGSRLVFVSASPQAVAWRLSTLTRMQIFTGYFFLEGDAGKYSLGMDGGPWADQFEASLNQAVTAAVIAGH